MLRLLEFLQRYDLLTEASESDAFKYSKRSFNELPKELQAELEDNNDSDEDWQRACFHTVCTRFGLRNSETMYYAPGLVRIAYGELDMDGDTEASDKILKLARYVKFISIAHKNDFTRFLVYKQEVDDPENPSKPKIIEKVCTYDDLDKMFGEVTNSEAQKEIEKLKNADYTKSDYQIIWLKDYKTAHQYERYTRPNTWCYFEDADTFKSYTNGGMTKLYLAVKPGFENLTTDDKGYGQSMLGIDINPGENGLPAMLLHVSNRYNHAEDPELDNNKNPPGDNRFNAEELSQLLGMPFYEACPPYTTEELRANGIVPVEEAIKLAKTYITTAEGLEAIQAIKCDIVEREIYTLDSHNSQKGYYYVLLHNDDVFRVLFDENGNVIAKCDFLSRDRAYSSIGYDVLTVYADNARFLYKYNPDTHSLEKIIDTPLRQASISKSGSFAYIRCTTANTNKVKLICGDKLNKIIDINNNWNLSSIGASTVFNMSSDYRNITLIDLYTCEILFDGETFDFDDIKFMAENGILLAINEHETKIYNIYLHKYVEIKDKTITGLSPWKGNKLFAYNKYNETGMYIITSDGELIEKIPMCKDIDLNVDNCCIVATKGGNRGFDIYNTDLELLGNVPSLKLLPKLMKRYY